MCGCGFDFFLFFFCMLPDFLGVESFRVSLTGHC